MHAELSGAICELRRRLEWSQEELAEAMAKHCRHTHPVTVSRWERGVDAPSPQKRAALARIAQRKSYEDLAKLFRAPISVWRLRSRNNGTS
jgi:transcriptional regulator with XRE-family HTH domain